jgi:hypothetical protein
MKSLLLAGALIGAAATACVAQTYSAAPAYSGYWVVGNGAIHSCEIVTSNPVIDYNLNSFGTGPYRSLDDARLARSTIGVCPKDDTAPAGYRMPEDGAADEPG